MRKYWNLVFVLVLVGVGFCDVSQTIIYSLSDLTFTQKDGYEIPNLPKCVHMDSIAKPMLSMRLVYLDFRGMKKQTVLL